ncbi:MAG: Fe-S cluster assembly protein SufD, partial [Chloroflexi bacterium]|nr:Fe-S cluster assembly protein SufD [Chloroflexota bacterium]
ADTYPHYAAAYAAQPDAGPPALSRLRQRGWDAFQDLGLPTARRGNEPWKYTNAGPIAREAFAFGPELRAAAGLTKADVQAAAPWQSDWRTLVLVDGVFTPALSYGITAAASDGLTIAPLTDAVDLEGETLLSSLAPPEDDGFVALNTAFLRDGVVISVPPDADAGVVNIVYLTTGRQQPSATYPRTLINAAANSRLTVIETFAGPDDTRYLTNAVTEASVAEGASVEHYRLLFEGMDAYHVGVSRVLQHKDSAFSSVAIARGAALGRNDFGVKLAGTGAQCTLNGLYLTKGSQHIDNYINIDHAEPYGTSRLFYKGILDGQSRAVFGGNVTVRKDAQKTDAQQTDKNLLLSELAEVDSKPSLLIYADDVKCGHGATAGHIDADTVFYMRSRGLDLPTASRILIHAFASEIIDTVALEPLREYLNEQFESAIPDADLSLSIGGR